MPTPMQSVTLTSRRGGTPDHTLSPDHTRLIRWTRHSRSRRFAPVNVAVTSHTMTPRDHEVLADDARTGPAQARSQSRDGCIPRRSCGPRAFDVLIKITLGREEHYGIRIRAFLVTF
jgi:hypothetical protein